MNAERRMKNQERVVVFFILNSAFCVLHSWDEHIRAETRPPLLREELRGEREFARTLSPQLTSALPGRVLRGRGYCRRAPGGIGRRSKRLSSFRIRFHCTSDNTARMSTSIISSRSKSRPRASLSRVAIWRIAPRSS